MPDQVIEGIQSAAASLDDADELIPRDTEVALTFADGERRKHINDFSDVKIV